MVGLHLAGTLWTCMDKIDFFLYVSIAGEQGSTNPVSGKVVTRALPAFYRLVI